jgi:hypothetical protein
MLGQEEAPHLGKLQLKKYWTRRLSRVIAVPSVWNECSSSASEVITSLLLPLYD